MFDDYLILNLMARFNRLKRVPFAIRRVTLSIALLTELCRFIWNLLQSVANPYPMSRRMRKMVTSLASFGDSLFEASNSSSLTLYVLQIAPLILSLSGVRFLDSGISSWRF